MALALVLPTGEAWAQNRAELRRRCEGVEKVEPEWRLASCTALIELGGEGDQTLAVAHYVRGYAYERSGDLDKALADLTEAIRLNPWFPDAYRARGKIYAGKRDYESATADFSAAIRIDPSDAWTFLYRGRAYSSRDLYEDALKDFEEAIRLDRFLSYAYDGRRSAYESLGQRDKAGLNDPNPATYGCVMGAFYGPYDEAIEECNKALAIVPDYPQALKGRAMILLIRGQRDAALADLNRALQIHPQSSPGLELRGIAHLGAGNLDAAIADLDEALRWEPRRPLSLYARGLARQRKGDKAGGAADIAAAKLTSEHIEENASKFGLK